MPAAYAHHRFGEACLEALPPKLKRVCIRHRALFDIGVHGPDILFYYKPLSKNKVNSYGSALHHRTGKQFFTEAKDCYRHAQNRKEAMLAYLLGFLAHFTLDSSCHDFINEEAEETIYSHNLIESQYEAFLMIRDGKDPLRVDRSLTLHPGGRNAEIIARFFLFEKEQVQRSLEGQKRTLHLFYSPCQAKKVFIRRLIALTGVKGDFGDLFLDRETIDDCRVMNDIIYIRQEAAAQLYPKLAGSLVCFLYDKGELDDYFSYDFEGV